MSRCGLHILLLGFVCLLLAGCSSAPPPAPSAGKEISDAERAIEAARNWDRKNEVDLALGEYKRAKEAIGKGMSFAEGTELAKLKNMEEEIRSATSKLEVRKLAKAAEPEKPKVPEVTIKTEDPEAKKRQEEAAARKKREEEEKKAKAEIAEKITAGTMPPAKKTAVKEDEPVPEAKKADEKGGEKAEDTGPAPIKKADGPYPSLSEKSPPVQICKLDIKGKFAVAYIQLFNTAEQGKRIVSWGVFFKDGNNAPIIDARTVALFPYNGFKTNVPDLIGGQIINALTTGSEQVTGLDGLRLVAVGEHDRVKDIKAVAVKFAFHDGTNAVGSGPTGEAPNEVPGLKSLEQKK